MSDIKQNILEAIGKTPMVQLNRIRPANGSRILVKVEALNPGGSIKIRPAYAMVMAAKAQGLLKPDSTIVEATSGNQGTMRSYGAELILTDPGRDIGEAIETAKRTAEEMARKDSRVFFASQFTNPANPGAHRATTAAEIIDQVGETGWVDAFVSGIGTGGTITGVGEQLKAKYPGCLVVAAEPSEAAILSRKPIGNHIQQGIGDGLIPDVLNRAIIDRLVLVTDKDAVATARRLAEEEGLFVGISSGTNVWAALRVAETLGPDKTVVTLCPDTGERYLSLNVFGVE